MGEHILQNETEPNVMQTLFIVKKNQELNSSRLRWSQLLLKTIENSVRPYITKIILYSSI